MPRGLNGKVGELYQVYAFIYFYAFMPLCYYRHSVFILSILFNNSEIADIMGDLTDGMRDLTGVINWRTHRWR